MALELLDVTVRFGNHEALDRVSLSVAKGELVAVLGPSGSGKTTLLRVVAGLERPTTGRVLLEDVDLAGVPAHARDVGLMFQDFALFPHRDVGGNVGFGLRMQGMRARAVDERVREVLELVGLPGTQRRAVSTLSGGEQQRVALARALAPGPRLLMLDEPMGSLDRALRERLPQELRAIFRGLDVTVLYVTHDQEEALAVADRTVLLRDGHVEADGPSEELWADPPSAFVARFLGYRNIGPAYLDSAGLETPWGPVAGVPQCARSAGSGGPERQVTVVLRPGAAALRPDGSIAARVTGRRFRGDHFALVVDVAGTPLEVEVENGPVPSAGEEVRIVVDPSRLLLLPAETGSDPVERA